MEKQVFIDTIEAIRLQDEHDEKCVKALSKVFNAFESNLFYKNHWLQNALVRLLQIEFDDNNSQSWIEYFLWEINFGKKESKITIDDNFFELKDASDLYDLLILLKTKTK